MNGRIRGEYWIQDGRVDFADGDVGDRNHEMIALDAICSDHLDDLQDYANELGVDTEEIGVHEEPFTTASELLQAIRVSLWEKNMSAAQASAEIMKRLGVTEEVYNLIGGGGDSRLYAMREYGWIAVRDNNAELFGYDQKKSKELADGVDDILDQEGIDSPDEEVELSVYDHKTGRSFDVTLADLKRGPSARPQNLPNTTYNRPLFIPKEKTGATPRSMDARTRSMLQTSEGKVGFKDWLRENCEPFIVRRSWPSLSGEDEARPVRRSCRRSPRSCRR